jgi:hypothetical protein
MFAALAVLKLKCGFVASYPMLGVIAGNATYLIAQSTSLSGGVNSAAGAINWFAILGAFAFLVYAGWCAGTGRMESVKYGIIGAALCGLSPVIVNALFKGSGSGFTLSPTSQ